MKELSDRLRELRGASSQAEMARELGMKQPQWARYESGASLPSIDVLVNICRVHACSADWLLGLSEGGRSVKARSPTRSLISASASPPRDCSKCKLMAAHLREITGRK